MSIYLSSMFSLYKYAFNSEHYENYSARSWAYNDVK